MPGQPRSSGGGSTPSLDEVLAAGASGGDATITDVSLTLPTTTAPDTITASPASITSVTGGDTLLLGAPTGWIVISGLKVPAYS